MAQMRIAAAVLAAGLAAGVLSGCGSSGNGTTQPPAPAPASSAAPNPGASGPPSSAGSGQPQGSGTVPRPAHVVIVVEENHSFSNIIGNSAAPYINSLGSQGALFTEATGVAHPSEPNYLALFSGSTQGVADDSCPHTFGADNLGAQLTAAGDTFAGYSEGLPSVGYTGCTAGEYARRHAPWTNFSSVAASASLPYTSFPQDYNALPTVSFVIPNVANDMHDGTIGAADTWLRDNLDGYAQWAKTHNSLLVVTWDEDEDTSSNHIATIFAGAQVKSGQYSEPIDHYRLLRTIEAAYGLAPLGQAANAQPVTDVWR
ncbi:alkaline phosphatase family protein [Sinomonas sp.]|uniref:alkaline phosphatase family protein n=1 Tax=Sinomonas sp. TaxID=1914986 RepID=UPI002FE19237